MKAGKAFELLVRQILLKIGFSEVKSDGWYILDNGSSQMIRGLGDLHDADVLLEPPVQTPFYTPTRLLVECKDYGDPVGLNIIRSALGLREDINHFELIDKEELINRYSRGAFTNSSRQYLYQVAVASMSGFTKPAQRFAAVHRISLIEFNKMPFWEKFCAHIEREQGRWRAIYNNRVDMQADILDDEKVLKVIDEIAERSAVAITPSGQMLFLYKSEEDNVKECSWDVSPKFEWDEYRLTWGRKEDPWKLHIADEVFTFQLPKEILKKWLEDSSTDKELKINAINCKLNVFSRMVVYYSEKGKPTIKMISIMRHELKEALEELQETNR